MSGFRIRHNHYALGSDAGFQQADQIFNAFFTTKPDGTGMGLRISRSIIDSHGGRLWAADNSPRGATFQFTLPATAAAATASPAPVTAVRPRPRA